MRVMIILFALGTRKKPPFRGKNFPFIHNDPHGASSLRNRSSLLKRTRKSDKLPENISGRTCGVSGRKRKTPHAFRLAAARGGMKKAKTFGLCFFVLSGADPDRKTFVGFGAGYGILFYVVCSPLRRRAQQLRLILFLPRHFFCVESSFRLPSAFT